MRVFLSHNSRHKPLVREVKGHFPHFLTTWLDEEQLLFGDRITASIESTIKADTDYVLLFIDEFAARSAWVQKEVQWALDTEKRHDRTLLLPVVIEPSALELFGNAEICSRKHIALHDFQEASVRALARTVSESLFALICRDMHRLQHPSAGTALTRLADAEAILRGHGAAIQKVVFPHRAANPLSTANLLAVLNQLNDSPMTATDLDSILTSLLQRNLVPGLKYDGDQAYLIEEHAQWKGEVHRAKKEKVGRKASAFVQNGMRVLLDAGSTIEELVRVLCKRIETRSITKLTVATTSVNIADMFSDCCVKMGFDDDYTAVSLFVPGGQIRPSTQAIVPCSEKQPRDLLALADRIGRFDLGFVGVNGIDNDMGFTTHDNAECLNKADILAVSNKCVVLGDSSKVGLVLEHRFAGFENGATLIVDDDPANGALRVLATAHEQAVVLA